MPNNFVNGYRLRISNRDLHYYRSDTEDIEKVPEKRSWYQQIDKTNSHKDIKWETPIQFPRSKWDSEDEETSSVNVEKEKIRKSINQQHVSLNERK